MADSEIRKPDSGAKGLRIVRPSHDHLGSARSSQPSRDPALSLNEFEEQSQCLLHSIAILDAMFESSFDSEVQSMKERLCYQTTDVTVTETSGSLESGDFHTGPRALSSTTPHSSLRDLCIVEQPINRTG